MDFISKSHWDPSPEVSFSYLSNGNLSKFSFILEKVKNWKLPLWKKKEKMDELLVIRVVSFSTQKLTLCRKTPWFGLRAHLPLRSREGLD